MNFANQGVGTVQVSAKPPMRQVKKFFHMPQLIINNHSNTIQYGFERWLLLTLCLLLIYITSVLLMNDLEIETRERNRKKLMQQNIRLRAELNKMEKEIDALEDQFTTNTTQQPQMAEIRAQIEIQERQIRQLKEVVDAGRQSNAKENIYYIMKEENELTWLKQELQTLTKEKEVVSQSHQDKVRKLAANEPLLKHKEEITRNWNETKKDNREMSLKMVELQRQIRRLHALKEMAKTSNASPVTNEELQLATLQTEIARMNSEMKMKEAKWKPNGQVLDNEYFTNRSTIQIMQKKIEELQKQEGIWRVRAAALRDESQILTDRERLSKVATMPKPEPIIIKPPLPSPSKQLVKPPTMERIIQKQIKDNIKNDKFVDLVRVASTPSSSVKKSIHLQPIEVENSQRQKSKVEFVKESTVRAPSPASSKIKKSQSLHNSLKREKSDKQLPMESNLLKEPSDLQNKNGNNWVGRRGKLKSKQAVNTSNLAELIQQKADEVKKINKKLEKEEEKGKQRSVSSPKKMRDKKSPLERIQSSSHLDNSKQKIKQKTSKQVSFSSPPEIKIEPKKQPSTLKKSLKEPVSPKGSQLNKQIQEIPVDKKTQSSKKPSKPKRQEQLVEKINIASKINNFPLENKIPKKIDAPLVQKRAESPREQKQQKQVKREKIIQTKPASPQSKQRPIFQIVMTDNAKPTTTVSHTVGAALEDENDGVPKIIKRKRKVEGQLVTTGTST